MTANAPPFCWHAELPCSTATCNYTSNYEFADPRGYEKPFPSPNAREIPANSYPLTLAVVGLRADNTVLLGIQTPKSKRGYESLGIQYPLNQFRHCALRCGVYKLVAPLLHRSCRPLTPTTVRIPVVGNFLLYTSTVLHSSDQSFFEYRDVSSSSTLFDHLDMDNFNDMQRISRQDTTLSHHWRPYRN